MSSLAAIKGGVRGCNFNTLKLTRRVMSDDDDDGRCRGKRGVDLARALNSVQKDPRASQELNAAGNAGHSARSAPNHVIVCNKDRCYYISRSDRIQSN